RARGHEVDEAAIKGALGMHRVKALGLGRRKPYALLRNDAQTLSFEAMVDGPGQVAPGRVGLDIGQRRFDRHRCISPGRKPGGYIGRLEKRQRPGAETLRYTKLRRGEVPGRRDCRDRLTAPRRVRAPP